METIRIMSGIALRGAFDSVVLPAFERKAMAKANVEWNPTNLLLKAIDEGQRADVIVVTDQALDGLAKRDIVEPNSFVKVAQGLLGVAVKKGGVHPDISTLDAFKRTLSAARSVAPEGPFH
jgi:molybdate transport system substrate-binding protein